MQTSLTHVLHEIILNGDAPAKAVAQEIGKPYTTMLREINPYDTGAKVGVDLLLPLMHATGDSEPLKYLAREMRYALVPLDTGDVQSAERPLEVALKMLQGCGELSKRLSDVLNNERMEPESWQHMERAGYEAILAILAVLELLRAKAASQGNTLPSRRRSAATQAA